MTEEAKQARREYMKRWRENNKDRVAKNNERFFERQAAKLNSEKAGGKLEGDGV